MAVRRRPWLFLFLFSLALPLDDEDSVVEREVVDLLAPSARPADLETVDRGELAEPEMLLESMGQ